MRTRETDQCTHRPARASFREFEGGKERAREVTGSRAGRSAHTGRRWRGGEASGEERDRRTGARASAAERYCLGNWRSAPEALRSFWSQLLAAAAFAFAATALLSVRAQRRRRGDNVNSIFFDIETEKRRILQHCLQVWLESSALFLALELSIQSVHLARTSSNKKYATDI